MIAFVIFEASELEAFKTFVLAVFTFVEIVASEFPRLVEARFVFALTAVVSLVILAASDVEAASTVLLVFAFTPAIDAPRLVEARSV